MSVSAMMPFDTTVAMWESCAPVKRDQAGGTSPTIG